MGSQHPGFLPQGGCSGAFRHPGSRLWLRGRPAAGHKL